MHCANFQFPDTCGLSASMRLHYTTSSCTLRPVANWIIDQTRIYTYLYQFPMICCHMLNAYAYAYSRGVCAYAYWLQWPKVCEFRFRYQSHYILCFCAFLIFLLAWANAIWFDISATGIIGRWPYWGYAWFRNTDLFLISGADTNYTFKDIKSFLGTVPPGNASLFIRRDWDFVACLPLWACILSEVRKLKWNWRKFHVAKCTHTTVFTLYSHYICIIECALTYS